MKIINAKDAKGSAKGRKGSWMAKTLSNTKRPKIGFHAPIKGGLDESLIVAKDTGCDAVQIFSRNPRGWLAKPLTKEAIDLFRKTRRQTLYCHVWSAGDAQKTVPFRRFHLGNEKCIADMFVTSSCVFDPSFTILPKLPLHSILLPLYIS